MRGYALPRSFLRFSRPSRRTRLLPLSNGGDVLPHIGYQIFQWLECLWPITLNVLFGYYSEDELNKHAARICACPGKAEAGSVKEKPDGRGLKAKSEAIL